MKEQLSFLVLMSDPFAVDEGAIVSPPVSVAIVEVWMRAGQWLLALRLKILLDGVLDMPRAEAGRRPRPNCLHVSASF